MKQFEVQAINNVGCFDAVADRCGELPKRRKT